MHSVMVSSTHLLMFSTGRREMQNLCIYFDIRHNSGLIISKYFLHFTKPRAKVMTD